MKQKPKKKIGADYEIRVDVYDLFVVGFYTHKKMLAWMEQEGMNTNIQEAEAQAVRACDRNRTIRHFQHIPKNASAGLVAHECVHTAHQVLSTCGVRVSCRHDEAIAFLVQYLVNKVLECTRRRK